MSATGLEVFDKTLQTTNTWLGEIMEELGPDRQLAWHVLGVVLRAIRDRLPTDLAAHLGAQLPLLIRGTYYEQYEPNKQPLAIRSLDAFLEHIGEGLGTVRPVNTEDALKIVMRVLSHHVDAGQVRKVHDALPEEVRNVWPEWPQAAE